MICGRRWFQSTPPRRGDLVESIASRSMPGVSIHAPARGRRDGSWTSHRISTFQSTPPRRGDDRIVQISYSGVGFNPRPREGATTRSAAIGRARQFQSTPPRRGDDRQSRLPLAPMRCFNPRPREGATTTASADVTSAGDVFQSTPPRRGDWHGSPVAGYGRAFQSTPPRRGDARGAERRRLVPSWFQSTPPRRGDRSAGSTTVRPWLRFQSTPPRRGDCRARRGPHRRRRFNPRPREGATSQPRHAIELDSVSIHAPAKGRRVGDWHRRSRFQSTPPRRGDGTDLQRRCDVSIHAPAKGRQPSMRPYRPWRTRFNPRPREGATARPGRSWRSQSDGFNPRPREGATSDARRTIVALAEFQSTPPRRGDRARCRDGRSCSSVSIHAPAKGRRSRLCSRSMLGLRFNPRPREGATRD